MESNDRRRAECGPSRMLMATSVALVCALALTLGSTRVTHADESMSEPEPGVDSSAELDPQTTAADATSESEVQPQSPPASSKALGGDTIALLAAPTVEVQKTAAVPGGGAVQPGMEFSYQIYVACTSTEEDCPGFVFSDVIPPGLDIVQLPVSNSTRTVTYDPGTRTLTLTYNLTTTNPAGTGWTAGANEAFDIVVRLPQDTDHQTGDTITNEAVVTLDGVLAGQDDADVIVDIPVAVTPVASKQWPGSGVVAGGDAVATATIGVANASSASAHVTSLSVTDVQPATWNHFDLTTVTLTALPQGATQAQLFVCSQPGSVCGAGDWVPGGIAAALGAELALPVTVGAGDVTGVRVVFTADGDSLPRAPQNGGRVELGLQLRDTFRSNGNPIAPEQPITVDNCAVATAQDGAGAPVDSAQSCASKQIWPSTIDVTANKNWVPDANGNWQPDTGEFAVAGAESSVTARVNVTNASPFPIHQVVITEPSTTGTTDFDVFDVDVIRLRFPDGATQARVQVTYATGAPLDIIVEPPPATQPVALDPARQPTSVIVTYTGGTAAEPAIAPGAGGGLDLHGRLTAAVTATGSLVNCADVGATGAAGTTPDSERPCGNLPVQAPNVSGTGVKSSSQTTIPVDQPVTFTMRLTNNGNLALIDPVLTDPVDPAASPNPFDVFALVSATPSTDQPAPAPPLIVEVRTAAGAWVAYNAASIPSDLTGVRIRVDGDLSPTRWVQLNITVQRRPGVANGIPIQNCFGAVADNAASLSLGVGACASVTTGAPVAGAVLTKQIAPGELPEWTPGLTRQEAAVTLRVANTGNLSARFVLLTDDDTDFFDAVDFVRFGTMVAPAGANRLRVDALVGGVWMNGTPTVAGLPGLPTDVSAGDVRGLRFTFTSTDTTTNGGFVLPPCTGIAAGCAGIVRFVVSPRPSLASDPGTPLTSSLLNTIDGAFETNIDGGNPRPIDPDTAGLRLVPGDPRVDVNKGPNSTILGPGSTATQTLTATNNGTTSLIDVTVVDALPAGLAFDELFDGGDGNPYTVVVDDLPAGYDDPPSPMFEITRGGDRIEAVRWTFGGWALPPNATITIVFQIGLEPGVTTGQAITNTMGVTGESAAPGKTLGCTPPDGTASGDQRFGAGVYCTDTASTGVIAGAAFQARKWVAGNPARGWWHPTLGFVPTGDGNCPSMNAGGVLYTATPCVALVDRGGQFNYILRVVNAGTEAATRMALVDNLPYQGDAGLIGGLPRGTAWNNRPTMAGPATYAGPGTATIGYSSAAPGAWCSADLNLAGPGCGAGDWSDGAGSSTTALRLLADFTGAPLAPGTGVEIRFAMNVPSSLAQDSDVTIAWNSFAHAEATQTAQGNQRILPAIEPIKVGVSPALPGRVSVGDYVWVDTNRNGVQNTGEPGIPGVRLTITGPGGGPVTDVFGNLVGPTFTDENGLYVFANLPILPPGQSYTVHIDPTSPALAPYVPTVPGAGGNRAVDSSTGSAVSGDLTVDGAHDPTLDFGFVLPDTTPPTTPPTTTTTTPPTGPPTTNPAVTSPPATDPPTANPPATGTSTGTLPVTGTEASLLLRVGALFIAAGALVLIARRRHAPA